MGNEKKNIPEAGSKPASKPSYSILRPIKHEGIWLAPGMKSNLVGLGETEIKRLKKLDAIK